jgi:hypothetical protein
MCFSLFEFKNGLTDLIWIRTNLSPKRARGRPSAIHHISSFRRFHFSPDEEKSKEAIVSLL